MLDADSKDEFIRISSVGGLRFSQVLAGKWWETVDFDLTISRPAFRENGVLSVSCVAHVLVAPQNLGNIYQFNGPIDVQEHTYADKLDEELGKAIKEVCKNATQDYYLRLIRSGDSAGESRHREIVSDMGEPWNHGVARRLPLRCAKSQHRAEKPSKFGCFTDRRARFLWVPWRCSCVHIQRTSSRFAR